MIFFLTELKLEKKKLFLFFNNLLEILIANRFSEIL